MLKRLFPIIILSLLVQVNAFAQTIYDARLNLLSVKSEGRLLSEILTEVSTQTGIDVYMSPAADQKIFADIQRRPIEDAIKSVIKPLSHAFVYQGELIEVMKIFEKSEAEAILKLVPGQANIKPTPSTGISPKKISRRKEANARAEAGARKRIERERAKYEERQDQTEIFEERDPASPIRKRRGKGWQLK